MIVISERINQLIKKVGKAIKARDMTYVQEFAKRQIESGANCLDVYVEDAEGIKWVIETIREAVDVCICIDTTEPAILKAALSVVGEGDNDKNRTIVNSIDLGERLEPFLALIREHGCECVALAMDEKEGIPDSARYLDAVMLNPLDKQVMSMLKAGEAVLGMDKRCRRYLRDYR